MGACAACGTDNPERARFCMSCGASLAATCPSCGVENPPGGRFCIECGSALDATAAAPTPGAAAEPPPEERRQATVLFADLSGFTAVAERTDPERVKSVVDRILRRLGEEVDRHGGSVDKYIGDNVMAVFGAPVAHEDDPERAVRAGLAMQAAMDEIDQRADLGGGFALRVGINSGEVLAGRVGDGYTVIGDVVNVAARLQAAARQGSVTVGETTRRLCGAAIEFAELEPLRLKGKAEPVSAWEAVRAAAPGRAARPARTVTPLIGRDEEEALLRSVLERVSGERRPHLVTILGDAGVGKTRLIRELVAELEAKPEPPQVLQGSCPAYGSGLAYWALAEVVRGAFGISDEEGAVIAWEKLREGVGELLAGSPSAEPPERLAAAIARPLGIEPHGEPGSFEHERPEQMRDRLFSAVRWMIDATAAERPTLLIVEDIHWADEGTLDLIEYLARWVRGPAMIACMARDELLDRRPGWGGGRINATTIALEPLGSEPARRLVAALLPAVGESLAGEVAERSGGNPLFAEEMASRIVEEGAADPEALPETVHSVLAARLDSLPRPERRVLQHASVVGQTFWEGSLGGLAAEERVDLPAAIAALAEKDLIVPTAGSRLVGEREYAFKHALVRDVAYSTLPRAVRARKHAEVGRFIAERAADRSEGVVGMVAEHLGRAAALGASAELEPRELEAIEARALEAHEAAGDVAAGLYSNREALSHYEAALGLHARLDPASAARIAEKLGDVALRLGQLDRASEAWERAMEHHRGEENLARVGDLHRKIGAGLWHKGDREGSIGHLQKGIDLLKDGPPTLELVRLYEEAASLYMHTGDNMLAIYAAEKALRLAERLGEAGAASRAHGIFGRVFGRIGDAERARENLSRSVELARETDPGEAIGALLALGYHLETAEADYEAAAGACAEALELAERTGELPSQAEIHASLAQIAARRGDWAEAAQRTGAAATLVEQGGLQGKLCFALAVRGLLRHHEGDLDGAVESLERAIELAEQVGRSEVASSALQGLAAALCERGDHADADQALARALDLCERARLMAQSLEAAAARAVNLSLWGRAEQARTVADEAASLAEQLRYPVGSAASLEARGACAASTAERERLLADAAAAWRALSRPDDAARCERLARRLAAA